LKQLGKGGCGEVYLAQYVSGKKQSYKYCAIKFIKNKKVFYAETSTMKYLIENTTCDYTPKIYSSCPKQRFLLMEYIQGENLTQKFESCGHYFSLKTVLMVLMELMRLTKEFYTSTGLVHVDIKPSNFMVDLKNKIYLIDFGYATSPNIKLPGQTGTPLFMSQAIQSQGTICPSFQDDIESIGYVMMYFLKGGKLGLPWGLFKTHSEIVAAKTDSNIYNFFIELKGTEYEPICNLMYNFLAVSRKRDIPFDEKDYDKLYDSILKVFNDCGFVNDQCYDWSNVSKKI
jgi:serine/threonine protein kinase